MILFLGDSFTWGQGLYYKKWLEQGKSVEYCVSQMPPNFPLTKLNYDDDLYRRTKHYPNLVAKHFNKSYSIKWGNGGSNLDIINILKNLNNQSIFKNDIDFVIIQFSDFTRPESNPYFDWNHYISKFNLTDEIIEHQVREISTLLSDVQWFCFSWLNDIGQYIEKNYIENYVPIKYNGKEYNNFEELDELKLHTLGIGDGHLNELGHEVIAKSIIDKVENK